MESRIQVCHGSPYMGREWVYEKTSSVFQRQEKIIKSKNSGIARAPPRKESNIFVTVEMILANFLIIKHTEVSSTILVKVN